MTLKRRICCFCEKWGSGGIESFLVSVFEHMDMNDLSIDLVAAQVDSDFYVPRLEACGIPLITLSGNTRSIPQNHAMFRALLAENRYDVVHLKIYHALSLAYAEDARRAGVPVRIAHSHNAGLRKSALRPLKLMLNSMARQHYAAVPTLCWACSGKAAAFLFLPDAEYQFIPNGIDVEKFRFSSDDRAHIRAELGLWNAFIVGEVGRLCQQKNQSFLLDVFKSICDEHPDSALLLIGEGDDHDMLVEKSGRLGLGDRVRFLGVSDRIPQLLSAMDVFMLPSLFEGLGIAAIEAQTSGLPTLCSDNVPSEVVITETAQRLPLCSGAAFWAERALSLRGMARRDMSQAAADAGFDVRSVAASIENIYRGGQNDQTAHKCDSSHLQG